MITRIFTILLVSLLLGSAVSGYADSARDMLAAGRVDDAIAALSGRLSAAPSDAESANLLCRAYFALEDWNHAEPACKKAAALDPNNSSFHFWLARVYGEKADRASFLAAASLAGKVRGEFERAVELNPGDVDARMDLAEYYIEAPSMLGGGERKAREQAQSIAAVNPAREHWVYARIAEEKKDYASAEHECRQYIELSHGDAEAWLSLAYVLRREHRFDEMEQALVRLSQSPMQDLRVLVESAQMLYRSDRNYAFAAELLRRYLAAGPVEAAPAFKAHYLLGLLLEKQGDKARAAEQYRTSLSLARNFALAQQALNRVAP